MSLANHFNKRSANRDKLDREINTFEDYRTARIRQHDGTYSTFRAGKLIAKEDAPLSSRFHAPTPVVTIVAEPEGKEKINRVRKDLDVNAPSMKL